MISLAKPQVMLSATVQSCLAGAQNGVFLATKIDAAHLERSEKALEAAILSDKVHALAETDFTLPNLSGFELSRILYEEGLVRRADGRRIYDQILNASPDRVCPLCGINRVNSLDHHLPKRKFSTVCVSASNLVPACNECNKLKGEHIPPSADDHTLHPYFDDVSSETWLVAAVAQGDCQSDPPVVTFAVKAPPSWSPTLEARAIFHLSIFDLPTRYSLAFNTILSELQQLLGRIYDATGADGVSTFLESLAQSAFEAHMNSYRGAAYSALAKSRWFCEGGFQF